MILANAVRLRRLGSDRKITFMATLVVFFLSCLLPGLGLIIDNRKLAGGCGHKPEGAPRCEACPNADRQIGPHEQGGCPNRRYH
jgi:hypothetical protein